tara:strand:+ start:8273 stop:8983 length:711 start_codon:yes stop_codon:yes gene_type:complete
MSSFIQKETFKRIVSDVKDIIKNPLHNDNIFYKHNESNILQGNAMIIGSSDTCYYNGFFFFEFNFPDNYPWKPPKIIYKTNDGITRFNPNLYRDGKVCLSILNTWRGDSWSSCQTIRSVLLVLQSILNSEPLLNEPGINRSHEDFNKYNEIITFKSYEYALYKQYNQINGIYEIFRDEMNEYFKNNKINIIQQVTNNNIAIYNKYNKYVVRMDVSIYSISVTIDYKTLIANLKKCS